MTFLRKLGAGIWSRITGEPVMTLSLLNAGILLAVGFGLSFTAEQIALVGAFFAAALGWIARSKVSPT
jgi:hypothetical protein